MNPNSLNHFLSLVQQVRQAQTAYWNERTQESLTASLKLETQLDAFVLKCSNAIAQHPGYKPEASAYAFFQLVATWRDRFRNYFKYKKTPDADQRVVKEMFREIKEFEQTIDKTMALLNEHYINENKELTK